MSCRPEEGLPPPPQAAALERRSEQGEQDPAAPFKPMIGLRHAPASPGPLASYSKRNKQFAAITAAMVVALSHQPLVHGDDAPRPTFYARPHMRGGGGDGPRAPTGTAVSPRSLALGEAWGTVISAAGLETGR